MALAVTTVPRAVAYQHWSDRHASQVVVPSTVLAHGPSCFWKGFCLNRNLHTQKQQQNTRPCSLTRAVLWFVPHTQDRSVETKYCQAWGMELVFSE